MTQSIYETVGRSGRIEQPTDSNIHRVLSSDRRRVLLDVLAEPNAPVRVEDLATAVARRDPVVDAGEADAVARVATSLHHVHLPLMADVGVLEYDPETKRIE